MTSDVTERGRRTGDVGTVVERHAVPGVPEEAKPSKDDAYEAKPRFTASASLATVVLVIASVSSFWSHFVAGRSDGPSRRGIPARNHRK